MEANNINELMDVLNALKEQNNTLIHEIDFLKDNSKDDPFNQENLFAGNMYKNSTSGLVYMYDGTKWILTGPQSERAQPNVALQHLDPNNTSSHTFFITAGPSGPHGPYKPGNNPYQGYKKTVAHLNYNTGNIYKYDEALKKYTFDTKDNIV